MKEITDYQEVCENCKKVITDDMKDNQQVIYASAEHTLSTNHLLNDPMFGGVYCSTECYREESGLNIEFKKGYEKGKTEIQSQFDDFVEKLKKEVDNAVIKGNKLYKDEKHYWMYKEDFIRIIGNLLNESQQLKSQVHPASIRSKKERLDANNQTALENKTADTHNFIGILGGECQCQDCQNPVLKLNIPCKICNKDIYINQETAKTKNGLFHLECYMKECEK